MRSGGYLLYRLRRVAARRPNTYFPLLRIRRRRLPLAVRRESDLCIEGFPRSANTYAVATFEHANPSLTHVARHLHAPAQLKRAVSYGVPTVLLVRHPIDAVASLLVRGHPGRVDDLFLDYIELAETGVELHGSLVVVGFEEMTSDPGVLADRLNERFGTGFERYEPSPDADAQVRVQIDRMDEADIDGEGELTTGRPSRARTHQLEATRDHIQRHVDPALRERATELRTTLLRETGLPSSS